MEDFMDCYHRMFKEKNPRVKYRLGLKVVKHYFDKADMTNAERSLETFLRSHASDAGITEEKMQSDVDRARRKGMKASVPRILDELESLVSGDGKKNFRYLHHFVERAFNYATECKMFSMRELCVITERLDSISGRIYGIEKITRPEDTVDWEVAHIRDIVLD